MQLLNQNMFSACKDGDALCVTTNGIVKWDGALTMGAGVAKIFKDNFKGVHKLLGKLVSENGNQVYYIGPAIIDDKKVHLFSFPTKSDWREDSKLELIEQSCIQLKQLLEELDIPGDVYIPQPGCGHGHLSWENQVEPIIKKQLSDDCYKICYGKIPNVKFRAELLPNVIQTLSR